MQLVVEKDKHSEIVVAPQLLPALDLRNAVVVGDATLRETQREWSVQIVEADGNYVGVVKDNQPTTRQAIAQLFAPMAPIPGWSNPPTDFRSARTITNAHGRVEERTLTASSLLNGYLGWPGRGQVFKLERRFTPPATGAVYHEIQFGLGSLTAAQASPERLLAIVRSDWGIETSLHSRRDVTFQEEHAHVAQTPGPGNTTVRCVWPVSTTWSLAC